jgi:hypothetical protein
MPPGKLEGNPQFQQALAALYGVAYAIRGMPLHGDHPRGYQDFDVPPPEGLWWTSDSKPFGKSDPADWYWTLMVRVPEFVNDVIVDTAIAELVIEKRDDTYRRVRFDQLEEGPVVQIMHIGPHAAEQASMAQMDAFTASGGYQYVGKHHEIYFDDLRDSTFEEMKTILRHPVALAVG